MERTSTPPRHAGFFTSFAIGRGCLSGPYFTDLRGSLAGKIDPSQVEVDFLPQSLARRGVGVTTHFSHRIL